MTRTRLLAAILTTGLGLGLGCKDDSGGASDDTGTAGTSGTASSGAASVTGGGGVGDDSTNEPDSTGGEADDDSDSGPGVTDTDDSNDTSLPQDCEFTEDFEGVADGEPWPSPWLDVGGVEIADVQGGRGRLRSTTSEYAVSRMFAPLNCTDFEMTGTFMFTDDFSQGAGFYGRQNGGYLYATDPAGEGYSLFVEEFRKPRGIGVWREVGGDEENLAPVEPGPVEPGVTYAVRLRVTQSDAQTTQLEAKYWRADSAEPPEWQVERFDNSPSLQGVAGGIALDAYTSLQNGDAPDVFFDDIVVTAAN